jgi:hypothetical protein
LPELKVRDAGREAGFEIAFGGDLSFQELELAIAPESAAWVIEVSCDAETRHLRVSVAPTAAMLVEFANAEPFQLKCKLPTNGPVVGFQARIFQRQHVAWPRPCGRI